MKQQTPVQIVNLKKIYVLGPTGSGKSTLTKKLSKILKITSYDMDDIRFIKKFTKVRSVVQRKKLVNKLLKKEKWIIDARGTDWDRHAMLKADLIIWLLTPFYKRVFRVIKRFIQRRNNSSFEEKFIDIFSLIKYTLKFRFGKKATSFKPTKDFLQKNNLNPIIIKTNYQLTIFLNEIKKLKLI